MGYPYLFIETFEGADEGVFTAETDGDSILDYPHFTELARHKQLPWRGAYCMRIRPAGGTASAYVQENDSFDTAAAGTIFIRFYVYLGSNFAMANADKFSLMELESVVDTTTEVACGLDRSGSDIRFWFNETAAAAGATTKVLGTTTTALGKWYCFEIKALIDDGAGNNGTIDGWVNDGSAGAQIATLDQGAIVDAKFGVIGLDATTTGTILMDCIIADELQVFSDTERFKPLNQWLPCSTAGGGSTTAEYHPVIGSGRVAVAVTSTASDGVLSLYDTDGVSTRLEPIAVIRNTVASALTPGDHSYEFSFGLYATLSGTNVQAFVSVERGGLWSEGALITYGHATHKVLP